MWHTYTMNDIDAAKKYIQEGKVIAFPSDTCYGLAVDPTNPEAMQRLYALKSRSPEKAVSIIFPSINAAKEWAKVPKGTEEILKSNLPGPFTFLLTPTPAYPLNTEAVAIRIPDNPHTKKLSDVLGSSYTATSANISNEPACYSPSEMKVQGLHPDFIIDAGELPHNEPSTVIDLRSGEPVIVREGSGKLQ